MARRLGTIASLALGIACATVAPAAAQNDGAGTAAKSSEAIREHIDEAEDMIESLLDWRHVLTTATQKPIDTPVPTEPANTLVVIPRTDMMRLTKALDALAAMVPKPAAESVRRPRADLRAHVEKAQEIARELTTDQSDQPVGTSGGNANGDLVSVDRSALERLEIEIDAIEQVAPRRLTSK